MAPIVVFAIKRGNKLTQSELNDQALTVGVLLWNLQTAERGRAVLFLLPGQQEILARLTRSRRTP